VREAKRLQQLLVGKIDSDNWRAVPSLAEGTAGPELNLRPFFEAYFLETSA
jgi:hypothetical protein